MWNSLFFCCMIICTVFPTKAFAYIDPGSASLVLQMIAGGIATVAVLVKMYWRRIVGFFRKNDENTKADSPAE